MKGKVVGKVVIDKSFDEEIKVLTKETLEDHDLEDVLQKEGRYLDGLVSIVKEKASSGEGFSVIFMVEVKKEL